MAYRSLPGIATMSACRERSREARQPRREAHLRRLPAVPDDGKRHELIDGEHYVTPSPNTKHQGVSGNLYCSSALAGRPSDRAGLLRPVRRRLLEVRRRRARPAVLSKERAAEVLTAQHVGRAGAGGRNRLAGTRATRRDDQAPLYDGGRQPRYWVVDPDIDVVRVYRRAGEASLARSSFARGG